MPFVRCKFYYQDTGAPVGRGCRKGSDCDFVHPSSPDWPDAPLPRQHVTEGRDGGNNRNSDRRGSGTGWGDRNAGSESSNPRGRRDSGWSSSSVVTGANRAGPARSSPIPTAPRAMQAGKASGSGWGSAPLGGTAWSASETRNTTQTTNAATSSSTSADAWGAANDTSWGAPTGGGWGAPTSGGWGEPTADGGSGWGEPTADAGWGDTAVSASTSAPPSAPAIPPPPPPTSAAPPAAASVSQQSPTRENAESIIWGDRKGKGREVVGMGTPQYGFTPRTPRSPNRSPERDPRRQVSSTFAAPSMTPTDYVAVASTVSKEMRQERDGVRMISSGIYVPKAWAGDGTATSSSNKNPFAFPTYYPPEKMDVDRHAHEEGAVPDVDSDLSRSLDIDHDADIPLSSRDQWKDYTRALASAICSNIDIRRLQETRAKVKRLHNSKMYASASQVAAHARLQELDDQASAELQEARSKYDTAIKHLMRYPLDGLPAPSDNDPRLKDAENVGGYVEDMKRWKAQIKESVDSFEEKIRQVEAEQQRVKEETLRLEEEQKQAVAAAEAEAEKLRAAQKWVPINSTRKAMSDIEETFAKLEERVTDLEYDFMDMREATPATGDVVLQRLVELGYCKPTEAQTVQLLESQPSLEEGEMPFVPPTPPMSNEELTEECEKLGKRLEDHTAVLVRSQQQLKELQERRITRDRSYHELAADNSHLVLSMKALEDEQREQADLLAQTDKDIGHLAQLLEQCKKDRPPPPPPPPTSEEITAEVLKDILPELRNVVTQALGKIKTGVDDALLKQQEVVCGQIATTLQPAMVIARTFGVFMERQPDVVRPPPPPPVQPTQSVQY